MKMKLTLHRKMLLYLLPTSVLIFGGAILFIVLKTRTASINGTIDVANELAEKYALIVETELERGYHISEGLHMSINKFHEFDSLDMRKLIVRSMEQGMYDQPDIRSFWVSMEMKYLDPAYTKDYGRISFTYFRDGYGNIKYSEVPKNMDGDVVGSIYHQLKNNQKKRIEDPYLYSFTGRNDDQILETSISIPLDKDGDFAGVVGVDLDLDFFLDILNGIDLKYGGYLYLLSNNGSFVSFPDEQILGEKLSKHFPEADAHYQISEKVARGESFNILGQDPYTNEESFIRFAPVFVGETGTPWSLVVSVPTASIKANARKTIFFGVLVGFGGILVLALVIFLISRTITRHMSKTTKVLHKLSQGEINTTHHLDINSGDELEEMANSVNSLIDSLNRNADFAKEIGNGHLEASFEKASDKDVLGNSLMEMRNSLKKAEEEEERRKEEERKQNWATEGLAKFGEILRKHNQNMEDLSFSIMSNLVDYVGAIQGALFVYNDNEEQDTYFELSGAIAYDRKKTIEKQFRLGEGLVGRCAFEKLSIYLEEVPENYVHITSGLGESNPRSILLVPAILNEEVYAVIELVSFDKLEPYQIEFIEKIGESIASTIANAKVSERTNRLLEQSKHQAEELAAQEEEMRQNLEELQATQEEVDRLRKEEQQKSQKLIEEVEKHRRALLNIIDHVPNKVFLKDKDGKMLIVNKAVLKAHNATQEELIGKSDLDFFEDKEEGMKFWKEEQDIIKSGKVHESIHEESVNNKGTVLHTIKYPFYIDYLDQTGILGVQKDITQEKENEREVVSLRNEVERLQEALKNAGK